MSFQVQPGEVLGIIGGNEAGKSTTLKILTRILRPTGALPRCGAGSARSSRYPPASIRTSPAVRMCFCGLHHGHAGGLIRQKFDEIVEFSGIEDFIDTPVKRYSSGMNARLGFSIAAHLDPQVLIIDEVLSVGDYQFQEKAFGRIHDMARSGIPVVLVSHQLDRVATLCTKALLLQQGAAIHQGEVSRCIDAYLSGD